MMHTWHSKAILFEGCRTPVASLGWKRNTSQLRHQKLHLKVPEHRTWRVNPLVKSGKPTRPQKGLEGCTGACKAEDARHRQRSPSPAAAALARWYWCLTARRAPAAATAPGSGTLGPSRPLRSPDAEGSPGNKSCTGCCVQLPGEAREHPPCAALFSSWDFRRVCCPQKGEIGRGCFS